MFGMGILSALGSFLGINNINNVQKNINNVSVNNMNLIKQVNNIKIYYTIEKRKYIIIKNGKKVEIQKDYYYIDNNNNIYYIKDNKLFKNHTRLYTCEKILSFVKGKKGFSILCNFGNKNYIIKNGKLLNDLGGNYTPEELSVDKFGDFYFKTKEEYSADKVWINF